jgi:hypothetical protein
MRTMMRSGIRLLAALLMLGIAGITAAESWKSYANPRFGTSADYPADRFRPLPPPENGDGQSFGAEDGATLAIFGSYNVENWTPAAYEKVIRSGGDDHADVSYRATGPNWLVLSGNHGDSIYYERYLFVGDVIHGMRIVYPRAAKASYDPIVARIARSLGPKGKRR